MYIYFPFNNKKYFIDLEKNLFIKNYSILTYKLVHLFGYLFDHIIKRYFEDVRIMFDVSMVNLHFDNNDKLSVEKLVDELRGDLSTLMCLIVPCGGVINFHWIEVINYLVNYEINYDNINLCKNIDEALNIFYRDIIWKFN